MSRPSIRQIAAAAARQAGLELPQLLGPTRGALSVARVRQRAMWAARQLHPPHSYPAIGRVFGRDHTTVLYAEATVDARRALDADEAEACQALITAATAEAADAHLVRAALRGDPLSWAAAHAGLAEGAAAARLLTLARACAATIGAGVIDPRSAGAPRPAKAEVDRPERPKPAPHPAPSQKTQLPEPHLEAPVRAPRTTELAVAPPPVPSRRAAPAKPAPLPAASPKPLAAPAPKGGGARGLELIRAAVARRAAQPAARTCTAAVLIAGRPPALCGRPVGEGQDRCSLHLPQLARAGGDRRLSRLAVRFESPLAGAPEDPDAVGLDGSTP